MDEKIFKGYISSEVRIKRLESIPLIYGTLTSGAVSRYYKKEDFPRIAGLKDGGYAKNLYLKKDLKNKRMRIEDKTIEYQKEESCFGILASGRANGSRNKLEDLGKKEKVIFWCNGVWAIIEKHMEQGFALIPTELARSVIAGVHNQINNMMSKLKWISFGNQEYVSSKELADLLKLDDLYSYWVFEGILHVMLNTDMRKGPYKLKRIEDKISICLDLKFINESNRAGKGTVYKIEGIDDILSIDNFIKYVAEIKKAFLSWEGVYVQDETAKFGYSTIAISIELLNDTYEKNAEVSVINTKSQQDTSLHISNVEQLSGSWTINNLGHMNIYNHCQLDDSIVVELDKNEYSRTAAHEFGHFIGLGDAYNGCQATDEVKENDIMWNGSIISSNDIEMILLAALKSEKQYYYSDGAKIISEAINN